MTLTSLAATACSGERVDSARAFSFDRASLMKKKHETNDEQFVRVLCESCVAVAPVWVAPVPGWPILLTDLWVR